MKKRYQILTICIFAVALLGIPATASTLAFLPTGLATDAASTFVIGTGPVAYSATGASGSITGTVQEDVYRNALGNLDFVYQFTNTGTDLSGVQSTTFANYNDGGIMTLDYNDFHLAFCPPGPVCGTTTPPSGVFGDATLLGNPNPTGAGLTAGGVIKIQYGPLSGPGVMGTSAIIVITTTDQFYKDGSVSLQDSATASLSTGFFAPTATPEPRFYGMLLAGLVLLFAAVKKIRANQAA